MKRNISIKNAPKKLKTLAAQKNVRLGTYTTVTTAVVIALLLVLNLSVSALPEKYIALDTTSAGVYSISEQTKEIVGELEQDLTIYYIVQEGSEDETVLHLLEHYMDLSDHVKVQQIDPVENPNFVYQYAGSGANTNSLVVASGERSRYVDYYDIYESEYNYSDTEGYVQSTSFNGEGALTSAIQYVTSGEVITAYALEGHGESELDSGLGNAVEEANMMVNSLNLLTDGEIPSDCDCLIINGPTTDLSSGEAKTVKSYLKNGGHLLLLTDCTSESMPNLYDVMSDYGVEPVEGMVVEGNQNYFMQNYANYLVPDIESHEITEPILSSGYYILAPFAHGLSVDADTAANADAEVSVLLQTSDNAYVKQNWENADSADQSAEDLTAEEGFPLAVAISASAEVGDEANEDGESAETRIVWYASTYLGYDQMNEAVSGANFDLLVNSMNWICDQEESITIHPKSLDQSYLTLTAAQSSRWTVVMVVLIPAALLIAGIIMWQRRRKL